MTTSPPRERALRATRSLIRGLRAHNAFQAAASIAFWFFLSVVPLLVLIGFLVAQVARRQGVDALLTPLLEVVPPTAEELVHKELERLARGSGTSLAPLGIAGYLWTASSGLHSLMDVFEATARVIGRAWWKKRVMALGWVTLGLAAGCSIAWLLVRVDEAVRARDAPTLATGSSPQPSPSTPVPAAGAPGPSGARSAERPSTRPPATANKPRGLNARMHVGLRAPFEQALAAFRLLATGMSLLAGFYRFAVEHPAGIKRRVWPGTLAAVAGWLLVSWAFGAYVVSIADYALYYGSLAAVAVLLVWLYLTSLALVVGAEVNALLEGARAMPSRGRSARTPPGPPSGARRQRDR